MQIVILITIIGHTISILKKPFRQRSKRGQWIDETFNKYPGIIYVLYVLIHVIKASMLRVINIRVLSLPNYLKSTITGEYKPYG